MKYVRKVKPQNVLYTKISTNLAHPNAATLQKPSGRDPKTPLIFKKKVQTRSKTKTSPMWPSKKYQDSDKFIASCNNQTASQKDIKTWLTTSWFKPWPFYPLVGGDLNVKKAYLTTLKKSQRTCYHVINCFVHQKNHQASLMTFIKSKLFAVPCNLATPFTSCSADKPPERSLQSSCGCWDDRYQ